MPILTAKLIGFIFGLLTHLKLVGRILQTLIMAILLMIVAALLADMAREGNLLSSAVISPFQYALVILPSAWYFLWHFNAMRYMGASEFSRQFKTLCTFLWFGVIGGYVWSIFGSMASGAVIAYIAIAIGIWLYIRKTRPYAQAAAEADDDTLIRSNAVKRTVMLITVGITLALGIFSGTMTAIGNAQRKAERERQLETQLEKQGAGALPLETPYEATVTAEITVKLNASYGITIPAGAAITVDAYDHIDGVYKASVSYKQRTKDSDGLDVVRPYDKLIIDDLSIIKPVE